MPLARKKPESFQDLIFCLSDYWSSQGCIILQPYDIQMGAATFHPATFLRTLGPEPWLAAYVQPSRRPTDGRYGENPNRGQHYYQFQVLLKPCPENFQDLCLASLQAMGIDLTIHDVRFIEDNWESPTLGAWGLGWEVWLDGMEIGQFTYFQQMGGLPCDPLTGEFTYGLERLAMYLQNKDSMYEVIWSNVLERKIKYGDIFHHNEVQMSAYNFEHAPVDILFTDFEVYEKECTRLLNENLVIPAYEMVIKASHAFNTLDARGVLSVKLRQKYILRMRTLSKNVAHAYYQQREALGFPLMEGR